MTLHILYPCHAVTCFPVKWIRGFWGNIYRATKVSEACVVDLWKVVDGLIALFSSADFRAYTDWLLSSSSLRMG